MNIFFGKILVAGLCFTIFYSTSLAQSKEAVSSKIYLKEYGISLSPPLKLNDTFYFSKSSKEKFKFVFFDTRGESYCERFINNQLVEMGHFKNSLDTLKRYTSSRDGDGGHSTIKVQKYFQPLRDGEWIFLDNKRKKRTSIYYSLGIPLKE